MHGCSWLVDIFPERRKESIFYVDREKRATCPSSLAGYSRLDEQKHRLIPRDRGSREEEREKERKRKREREWRSFVTRQNSSEENGSSWRLLRRGEAVIHPMHSVELDRNIQRIAWMGLHALHEWTFVYLWNCGFPSIFGRRCIKYILKKSVNKDTRKH